MAEAAAAAAAAAAAERDAAAAASAELAAERERRIVHVQEIPGRSSGDVGRYVSPISPYVSPNIFPL